VGLRDTPHNRRYDVPVGELNFVWDAAKDRANQGKHGVRFEEAATVSRDENAKLYFDPDHSDREDRFFLLGLSFQLRVLNVCRCWREAELVVRILSARKADCREQEACWSLRDESKIRSLEDEGPGEPLHPVLEAIGDYPLGP
jgi:uncharacterized protein